MGAAEQLKESLSGKHDQPALRLYDIVNELNEIDALLDESEGDLTEEIQARLDKLTHDFDKKVDSVCRLRTNRIASADACDVEIARLQKRKKAHQRSADSLRLFLLGAMTRLGKEKVKTAAFTVYMQKATSIRWTKDVADLPEQYRRVTIEPNKTAAKEVLELTGRLPEGFVQETTTNLTVR